jgi:hypothetical protein
VPTGETTRTPLLNPVTSLINTLGDDLFSTIDLAALVDPTTSAAPTTHYGPCASGSSDSGTCGNYWADDTFDRHFTVFTRATGITAVEQFKGRELHNAFSWLCLIRDPAFSQPEPVRL